MTASHSTTAPVVLATDGTSASDGALRYAVEQARTRGGELRILHVMPMAVPVPPLRPVEPSVLASEAKPADLVVVRRAHEHRPWDHLGATVRALLLASPAPVEVVPAGGVAS